MPIKPIDLQTLFSQLNQVGRQQSAEKDGASLHAGLHGNLIVRMEDEASKTVHRPKDDQTAAKSVNNKNQGSGSSASGQGSKDGNKDEQGSSTAEIISDPDLGSHIDISG